MTKTHGGTVAHFLAGLALGAPPLTGAAVGAMLVTSGAATEEVGISGNFVRELEGLIKPGTSILFLLDQGGDRDAILQVIDSLASSSGTVWVGLTP